MPIFIWRPSSFAGPEKGATIPNRISLSETPQIETLLTSGVVEGSAAATIVLEDELVAGEPSRALRASRCSANLLQGCSLSASRLNHWIQPGSGTTLLVLYQAQSLVAFHKVGFDQTT